MLIGSCLLFLSGCGDTSKAASPAPPPLTVEVATVFQQDTPIYNEWIATLDGYVNAQIQPHVSGYIIRQNYKEGSVVKKEQVLFEIDPRPFKAALDQAKAQLAQAKHSSAKPISMSSETHLWRKHGPSPRASSIRKFRQS
ncbi:MAG TPA: biotin/lipoyl-binding protein [Candidatus Angelobacter sp.]|nr:biotin/lipoyl-binding protein [Candidatus Angelobacter sp.]